MRNHVQKGMYFSKTMAVGGLVFLLPLIVVLTLIGQAVPIVVEVARVLNQWLPIHSALGYLLVIVGAVTILVLLCFIAGIAAQRSFVQRIGVAMEKNLLLLFPRYAIFKEQLTGNIGGDFARNGMKPVLVRIQDTSRMALEVERNTEGMVTIYLPSSPDPWTGAVVFLKAEQVTPLAVEVPVMMSAFERLGRDSLRLIERSKQ
jgi:uncharacterized membrane protein